MSTSKILFIARSKTVSPLFSPLKEEGVEAGITESLSGALNYVQKNDPSLIFSQADLPGYRVDSLLEAAEEASTFPPVIIFAEQGSASEAKRLMEAGAKDYWLAPLTWEKIRAVLPQSQVIPEQKTLQGTPSRDWRIIGEHPSMQKVMALAKQVAPSRATILISGESGTGKEMMARFIHQNSPRDPSPFIAINCAALPEHLLESELFGHEKGSFTGAISRKLGKFEMADKGTLLLDEISEMDLGLQAKLLRVLQEGELDRVGGTDVVSVDVRVLATTNRNLQEYVDKGEFRQDLYYRLNVIPIKLPPLRERGEDVIILARHFIERFCREYNFPVMEFAPDGLQWLKDYDWPGNVRELQNLMERAVLLAGRGPIQPRHFLLEGEELPELDMEQESVPPVQKSPGDIELTSLHEMEKKMILKSLDHTAGNRTQAAQLLGISVRTLRNKLSEYKKEGISIP